MWPFRKRLSEDQQRELEGVADALTATCIELDKAFAAFGVSIEALYHKCGKASESGSRVNASKAEVNKARSAVKAYRQKLQDTQDAFTSMPLKSWFPKDFQRAYEEWPTRLNMRETFLWYMDEATREPNPLSVLGGINRPNKFFSGFNLLNDFHGIAPEFNVKRTRAQRLAEGAGGKTEIANAGDSLDGQISRMAETEAEKVTRKFQLSLAQHKEIEKLARVGIRIRLKEADGADVDLLDRTWKRGMERANALLSPDATYALAFAGVLAFRFEPAIRDGMWDKAMAATRRIAEMETLGRRANKSETQRILAYDFLNRMKMVVEMSSRDEDPSALYTWPGKPPG